MSVAGIGHVYNNTSPFVALAPLLRHRPLLLAISSSAFHLRFSNAKQSLGLDHTHLLDAAVSAETTKTTREKQEESTQKSSN